jgi:peptidoglycan/LPS O-acetylase OafA/YrhL
LFSSVLLGVWLGGVVGWWGLLETVTYTRNLIFPNATTIPAIWQPPNGSVMQLNHFWSLAIEEQFYFVWPLLVYLLQSRRKIAIACVLGIVASFSVRLALLHHGYLEQYPYLLSSWTPSRLDGLFGGALLAMVVRSRWETAVLKWSWIGVVGSFVGLCLLGRRYPYLNYLKYHEAGLWVYPLLALLFVSTIACSLRSGALLNRFFALPVMRFFGRYSYGLYVYHYTIAGMVEKLRPAVAQATGSKMLGVALPAMLGLGMTVVISMASFHWFEARFLRLKRKFEDHTHTPKLEEYVKAG